ncbi:MAG: Arylsulfatase [Planctomycetes bacterium ADurb.Bin126]|nr:MAG: Arylsulfatase [Planctomycetes bacterium ADurb.Bin126]HOD81295.1 sulfatase [Phycisphaerae bacterium]HQL73871.1 sulfatase [Phycisphaerae bacterium]
MANARFSRRETMRLAGAAAAGGLLGRWLTAAGAAPAGAKRPNILLAIADDASYPHMSAYGCTWVKTPAFDRVAREGMLFTNVYTPTAKCAPSRSCLLTGRNPWQLEEAANHVCFFPAKFKTFMEALGEHGYHVGHVLKGWAPGKAVGADGKRREMTGKAYNRRTAKAPTTGISSNDYAANFADFLDARPEGLPFCFWYGSVEPHRGYEYGTGPRDTGRKPGDVDRVPAYWPDNQTVRTDMLDYARELEHFDLHLARMLKLLEERGELDNTLVIVTADNGMPFPRSKGQCYEVSNHMPFAAMWKAGQSATKRTVDDFVSFADVAATCLDLAGLSDKQVGMAPLTGRSLAPLLRSDKSGRIDPKRDHVLIGRERNDVGRPADQGYPVRGIVKDGFLYVINFEPSRWPACNGETGYLDVDGSPTKTLCIQARKDEATRKFWKLAFGKRGGEELYNIKDDPDCMNDLAAAAAHADRKKALREQLLKELTEQADPRVLGKGEVFDKYLYADERTRNFYERYTKGEKVRAGWVNPSDFEPAPIEE